MKAEALAHPNIALVKYWGKRDVGENLPAVGSISVTLDALSTRTSVSFDADLPADALVMASEPGSARELARVSGFLDRVRALAGITARARVETHNDFPTGAGLASSASGFAALAVAATQAAGLRLEPAQLSALARLGSGSAARSVFGGFAEMAVGRAGDGADAFAAPLAAPEHWPLRVLIAITAEGPKEVGSTEGMERTRQTSPFYDAWVSSSPSDLQRARQAILARDFEALAEVSEHSCMKMHGLMMSARPPLVYWNTATLALLQTITALRRRQGVGVFFTIDAGPQVKAVCLPEAAARVEAELSAVEGVRRILSSGLGRGARLV